VSRRKNTKPTLVLIVDLGFFRLKLAKYMEPVLKVFHVPYYKTKQVVTDKLYLKIVLVASLTLMVLFNSFSWFYNEYVGPGALLSVGRIDHVVTQYDDEGIFIEEIEQTGTVIYESNMGNTTRNSKFIEIENDGTLNMDYNITFQLDGTIGEAGVMYYRLYEITNEVEAAIIDETYDTKLKAYAYANPINPNIETDTTNPIANLSTIGNFVRKGSIRITGDVTDSNPRYYRLDYGMYDSVNSTLYNDKTISVHMNVYATQYGQLSEEESTEQTWLVVNQTEVRDAINSALPGNTIKLLQDIVVDGTLTFNKRLHLNTNGYKLTVTGDMVYDFVDFGTILMNLEGSGVLEVNGNLYMNTPKSEIHFIGSNDDYDLFVGGIITLNGIQEGEKDGVLFESTLVVSDKTLLTLADLNIMSNTRLNVGPGVSFRYVKSTNNAANIEIINNGSITQVQLSNMSLLPTFTKAQIYIYNLANIYGLDPGASILLPSTATPYLGPNDGNTLIIRGISSSDITVSGSANYDQDDIVYDNTEDSVFPIVGEANAFNVIIKDSGRSLENLLNSYFLSISEPDVPLAISQIKKLVITTTNAQYLVNTDFDYMKSSYLSSLEFIDLSLARVRDADNLNRIKSEALSGKVSLKTVILPDTLTSVGSDAFYNVNLGYIPASSEDPFYFLNIPASVTSIEAGAFNNARYVKFLGVTPPTIGVDAFNNASNGAKLFVPGAAISLYQGTTNLAAANIHQSANLSDNREYFVYDYDNGTGVSLYIGATNVGTTLGVPSYITFNGYELTVKAVGTNSYRNVGTDAGGAVLTLPSTVNRVDYGAFYNLNLTSANLNNLVNIGAFAFYNNRFSAITASSAVNIGNSAFELTTANTLTLTAIETIGEQAFASAPNLYEARLAGVKSLGYRAFYDNKNLSRVYFTNTETKYVNNLELIDLTLGDESVFSNWGFYIDGRLRVYVPDGISVDETPYIDLYKSMFSANEQYVFVTGSSVNSYYHFAVPYDITQYTVKEVTINNHLSSPITGWEIISYQGADLNSSYQFPTELTVGTTTLPVISIGKYAFYNVLTSSGHNPVFSSTNLLSIKDYAFKGKNIQSFTADNAVFIGNNTFENSTLKNASFSNLLSLGEYAFANNSLLYSLNLGKTGSLGTRALYNLTSLQRLYLLNDSMNMTIGNEALGNITFGANRFRIYVPDSDQVIDYYKSILSYPEKIYATGTIVGSYVSNGENIGEYAIKEVTINNASGTPVTGWEIIEYHGANLTSSYVIPTTFTVESTTYDVISIGREAYINVAMVTENLFDVTNTNLLRVRRKAFQDFNGVNSFTANNVVSIGDYAFEGTPIKYASFNNLNTMGSNVFQNNNTLYSLNLGKVKTMGQYSVASAPYLHQLFFEATDLTLSFHVNSLYEIGTLANNRLRVYVTDANASNGTPFVDVYRGLIAGTYTSYFYPRGTIIGSYTPVNTTYDIGIYSVRAVTIEDANEDDVTGWELIEYHGDNLTEAYNLPNALTVGANTYDTVAIGEYAFAHTIAAPNNDIVIDSDYLLEINEQAFYNITGIKEFTGANVVRIGDEAFRNNGLMLASFPSLEIAGDYAFANNTALNYIHLGNIASIGDAMLYNNTWIEQIFISNEDAGSTTMNILIGTDAFYNVGTAIGNRLRIYVPNGLASGSSTYVDLYKNTFPSAMGPYIYGTGYIVGSYVHSILPYDIGEYAIKEVTRNDITGTPITGWEIIDYHGPAVTALYEFPTTFTVGETTYDVISIGPRAFIFAEIGGGVTWELELPVNLFYIGDYAFTSRQLYSVTGYAMSYIGLNAFENCDQMISASFGSVKELGAYAFYMADALQIVKLGTGVVTIGNYSLYHTSSAMTDLYIETETPPTITSTTLRAAPLTIHVPFDAYQTYRNADYWEDYTIVRLNTAYLGTYLYNIINTDEIEITGIQGNNSSLTIPDYFVLDSQNYDVTSLAPGAFDVTGQLKNLTLPQYLKQIPDGFLGTNDRVENVYVHASNAWFSSTNGVLYDKTTEVVLMYPTRKTGTSYTLPSTVKAINAYAFLNNPNIVTLYINSNLTMISHNAFINNTNLRTFRFASSTPPFVTSTAAFPIRSNLRLEVPTAAVSTYQNKFTFYRYRDYVYGY
jgi:hypothetical protein